MRLFLFERVEQVSENYHPGGGLVIVANSEEHARSLIADSASIKPTDEEWAKVRIYFLDDTFGNAPHVYVFPDAGCC